MAEPLSPEALADIAMRNRCVNGDRDPLSVHGDEATRMVTHDVPALLAHVAYRDAEAERLEAESDRFRSFEWLVRDALRPARERGFDGPTGVTKDEVIERVISAVEKLDKEGPDG